MRVRFRFAKTGKVRWTSHRDVARMWERAIRRADLPVAYTEGFSPRPKMAFGLALPTGYESVAEYLDIDFEPSDERPVDVDGLPALLTPALPVGVEALAAAEIDRSGDSLQHQVVSCEWDIIVSGCRAERLQEFVDTALAASIITVTRERKGKPVTDDVRPALVSLTVDAPVEPDRPDEGVRLIAELASQTRALRPSELLAAMSPELGERRVCRTHQWIERDGAQQDILPLPATDAPPAMERVS
ncbi:MAG: TIGR03936 family radical SAM-associated protein [Acidimicrobiales bacterium]